MIPEIAWCSPKERLDCFDALIVLAHRGVITIPVYKQTMEIIMQTPVLEIELTPDGIEVLRRELVHKMFEEMAH